MECVEDVECESASGPNVCGGQQASADELDARVGPAGVAVATTKLDVHAVKPIGVYDSEIRNAISGDGTRVTAMTKMHPDAKGPKRNVLEVITSPTLRSGKSRVILKNCADCSPERDEGAHGCVAPRSKPDTTVDSQSSLCNGTGPPSHSSSCNRRILLFHHAE